MARILDRNQDLSRIPQLLEDRFGVAELTVCPVAGAQERVLIGLVDFDPSVTVTEPCLVCDSVDVVLDIWVVAQPAFNPHNAVLDGTARNGYAVMPLLRVQALGLDLIVLEVHEEREGREHHDQNSPGIPYTPHRSTSKLKLCYLPTQPGRSLKAPS